MQAKYKLLANHSTLLGNEKSSKLVPGYDPGHTFWDWWKGTHSALIILKAKLDEILPIIKEEPKETRGCKKKAQSQEEESTPTRNGFQTGSGKCLNTSLQENPQGRYFHFQQILCRRLLKCSDLHELVNTEGTKKAEDVFNCFAALALVIKEETNAFYNALLRHPYILANQAAFAPFIKYFETQWVGVFQGAGCIKKGSDSIQWNCYK
ncbi:hypothetical protein DSO57_1020457 [Entomophthora muscae]|uniref:Uncharacterized protein n=1 Tax=Entomophthora muscae TaxID=34485 RepID=A0ACC2T3L1_9FUNG|nr:hypothetical protein DSO57_1020457 [Entomophthora muscae]